MGTSWDEFLHFKTYPGWNHIKTIQKILRIHGALSWERGVPVTNPGQPIKGSFSLCLLRFAKKTHQLQPYFSDKKRKWFLRKGRRRLVASSNHAPKQPKREKLHMRRSKTAIFCTQEIAKKNWSSQQAEMRKYPELITFFSTDQLLEGRSEYEPYIMMNNEVCSKCGRLFPPQNAENMVLRGCIQPEL